MAFAQEKDKSGYVDKLVTINRVAKVVKGGRRFSFSAIVVVGDENGRVGWGAGKAKEVPEAVRKATDNAKRRMVRVAMRDGRTLHHDIQGHFGASKVMLRSAQPGRGIIAGGPMRAIFEAVGIKDVVAKAQGSRNPYNMIQATFEAFENLETPRGIASKRGKKTSDFKRFRAEVEASRAQSVDHTGEERFEEKSAPAEKPKKAAAKKPAKNADKSEKAVKDAKAEKPVEKKAEVATKKDSVKAVAKKASESAPKSEENK